jgi:hypothetical protein
VFEWRQYSVSTITAGAVGPRTSPVGYHVSAMASMTLFCLLSNHQKWP